MLLWKVLRSLLRTSDQLTAALRLIIRMLALFRLCSVDLDTEQCLSL